MHNSDNFLDIHIDGINAFTLSNRREMCSRKLFFTRVLDVVVLCLHYSTIMMLLWVQRDVFSGEGGVDEVGDTHLTLDNSLKKLHCLIASKWSWKNVNWPRGATGDPTRAWWRVQPWLLTQKHGQFLHHITRFTWPFFQQLQIYLTRSETINTIFEKMNL